MSDGNSQNSANRRWRAATLPLVTLLVVGLLAFILLRPEDGTPDSALATQTSAPFSASVMLTHPPDGAILYAESLVVQGVTEGASQRFLVALVTVDDVTVSAAVVDTPEGAWSVELPHRYGGEPVEATVRVVPDDETAGEYDRVTVLLADPAARPEGVYGQVDFPPTNLPDPAPVGGEMIPVEGRASGVEQVQIALLDDAGSTIYSAIVTLVNPYLVDDLPWQIPLLPDGYEGPGEIVVTLDTTAPIRVPVIVSRAAG